MVLDRCDSSFRAAALMATGADATSTLEMEVTALFDRWRSPLLGYVVTLGLPVQEGEEIVQEVFLCLFQHLQQGKSRENLRGWIFRVGHHLTLKRRYAAGRNCLENLEEGAWDEVRDMAPDPEQAFASKQRQQRLLAVVQALPEMDRCCLHLRAEGLRYREIAEVLGISLAGVALCLGRSLERLKRVDR